MLASFEDILKKPSIFKDRSVLSPHYIPKVLPYREKYIEQIMKVIAPALKGDRARNVFIYGKTGTGKTSSVKYVMKNFNETAKKMNANADMLYVNCRVYNSRYRIFQKLLRPYFPELDKSGFGMSYIYEKLLEKLNNGTNFVIVLDEIDMTKDLDDLVYTLIRSNDESNKGSLSLIGISNKLTFKSQLDPRSRSSLNEVEIIFPPYDAKQLFDILKQRVEMGFRKGSVDEGAISLIAAITSQENGDARFALKLLLKAGEVAEDKGCDVVKEEHVEEARRLVEYDLAAGTIRTLPENQQILLYAIAKMTLNKRVKKIGDDGYLFSGDVYNYYVKVSRSFGKHPRSARWYREYINDLESVGLISTVFTSKGMRGHTRLIKIGHNPNDIVKIIEKNFGVSK